MRVTCTGTARVPLPGLAHTAEPSSIATNEVCILLMWRVLGGTDTKQGCNARSLASVNKFALPYGAFDRQLYDEVYYFRRMLITELCPGPEE